MFSLPWYTYLAVGLVVLFVLGCMSTIATMVFRMCGMVFCSSWWLLWKGILWLCGIPLTSAGTAHFATTNEATKAGVFNETGLPLAVWKDGRIVREPRGSHIAVVAPPRSGKSFGIVMPVLRHFKGSVICTDLRGELAEHTAATREQFGPVFIFAPASPQSPCAMNVLDAIRWNSPQAFGDVDRVVHHLLGPTGNAIQDGFRQNAIPLLRGIIFDRYSVGKANLPDVLAWMQDPTTTLTEKCESLLNDSPDPVVQKAGRTAMNMSVKLRQGVWTAITEELGIFEDPVIAENTKKSDCYLADLISGAEPITIYLQMGFHEITRLGRFFGLFVECLVALVSAPHEKARHTLLLCLDEMMNLGRLRELENAVSHLQGSGCQCLFVLQNLRQFLNVYGNSSPLLSSISTSLFYAPTPTDTTTSMLVSQALGTTTIRTIGTMRSAGEMTQLSPLVGREILSHNVSERARLLMLPDEVARMPNTDAIVFLQEHPPLYATKFGGIPPSRSQRWASSVARHPGIAAAVGACCTLAFALWPLTHVQLPTMPSMATVKCGLEVSPSPECTERARQQSIQETATASRRIPLTSGPWSMMVLDYNTSGKPIHLHRSSYASLDACAAALRTDYEPLVSALQQTTPPETTVTREHGSLQWIITWPRQQPLTHRVWCEKRAMP